jgi:hypothetical protein
MRNPNTHGQVESSGCAQCGRFGIRPASNPGSMGRKRLTDSIRRTYGEWQWRSAGVWAAYERWAHGRGPDPTLDFAAYRVALDLEERACRRYVELAQRA